jgi:hypothetical protein
MTSAEVDELPPQHDATLHRRTLRKLDWLLLPFLALLFLFNALDKSNVGRRVAAVTAASLTRDFRLGMLSRLTSHEILACRRET